MSTDDLRAQISAVEQEITRASFGPMKKHRRDIPWVMIIGALLLFIIVDRVIESGTDSGIETDLNHMMQQAKHEVLEYRHDYGTLPKMIHNPSLRPYISISDLGSNRFVLKGRLGNIKQELIEH